MDEPIGILFISITADPSSLHANKKTLGISSKVFLIAILQLAGSASSHRLSLACSGRAFYQPVIHSALDSFDPAFSLWKVSTTCTVLVYPFRRWLTSW